MSRQHVTTGPHDCRSWQPHAPYDHRGLCSPLPPLLPLPSPLPLVPATAAASGPCCSLRSLTPLTSLNSGRPPATTTADRPPAAGVHCKNKPTYDMWNLFCRTAPKSLTNKILENMKISTVMKCPQSGRCSLHLNIIGTVNLDEYIRGVEICTMSMSSQQNQCMYIRLTKIKGKKYEPKVHVQANCFEVGVSEHVFVTMKTVPDYCGIETSKDYHVQDCHNKDLGKHLLPCLTGKLDYMVNEDKKYIVVFVSNIPEDFDYNVRLCVKNISCHDTGAHALIKKDNSTKTVTLTYSEIVPCLCIEGWLQFPDSRRTRLCPFKNGHLNVPVNSILPESHQCT